MRSRKAVCPALPSRRDEQDGCPFPKDVGRRHFSFIHIVEEECFFEVCDGIELGMDAIFHHPFFVTITDDAEYDGNDGYDDKDADGELDFKTVQEIHSAPGISISLIIKVL
jgi:hypothetical protein